MNFFKSVFADEPDPSNPESDSESESGPTSNQDPDPKPQPDPNPAGIGGWNFGDLIKTIATKSETVIETYRRDLQEFGSGLKKEIEVAQGSLETVGTRIDELGNTVLAGTAQIISQGILAPDHESDSSDSNNALTPQRGLNSNKYSRFESQVRAIQGDVSTYCEEPEDLEEYRKWKSGFVLEEKREEIEGLLEGNGAMESIYNKVAPNVVDDETFWSRYYYRVYKLKQAEDVRANLVKRAISVELDEELSWDVDDDESEGNVVAKSSLGKTSEVAAEDVKEKELKSDDQVGDKGSSKVGEVSTVAEEANVAAKTESISKDSEQKIVKEESSGEKLQSETSKVVEEKEGNSLKVDNEKKESAVESGSGDKESEKKVNQVGDSGMPSKSEEEKKVNVEGDSGKKDLPPSKSDDKEALEVKNEAPASSKESGVSAASVGPSVEPEEEDLGWDEIEDLSSIDEKKANPGASGGVANRAELQKRLSTAEEEEDLSWDIDDDDEPAKA